MFSKLTFAQKLGIWLGSAVLFEVVVIAAICFHLSKNGPPKDLERFIDREVFYRRYYDDKDWQKEEHRASGQISAHPKSGFWYAERGHIRWNLKNYSGAEHDYDNAYRLDPTDYKSLSNRGAMRSLQGNHTIGLDDVNKAISMKPSQGWLYANRGYIYFSLGKYDDALKDFDKCLETSDEKRRYHAEKARIYMAMQRFDKAVTEYEKGVSYSKTTRDDDSYKRLVRLYISVGEIEKAQQACQHWLEEPEIDSERFRIAANVSQALGDKHTETEIYDKYAAFLDNKIGLAPTEMKLYEQRAEVYEKLGDSEKARADYKEILEDYQRNKSKAVYTPPQLIRFGEMYELIGLKDEMQKLFKSEIANYDSQIKQYPKNGYGYLNRAELYAKLGNEKAAMHDFETAKKLQDSSSIANAWARFALKKGKYDLALMLRQEFLGTHNAHSYSALAEVWEAKGNHSAALGAANTALTLDRFLPDAYYWLGKARAGQGDFAESKRRLQQATAFGYDPAASEDEGSDED